MASASRLAKARIRALFCVPLATIAFLVSCQLLVPSDVPDFQCSGSDPSSCPSGMVCNAATSVCVTSETVIDGGATDGKLPGDALPDRGADTGLAPLGATCSVDRECIDGLCGTTSIISSAILKSSKPFCTKPCCSSTNCPTGFVCYAAGTGGNYCVPADAAERTPPSTGGKAAGELCFGTEECRSGFCKDGRCLDTCCGDNGCSINTVCRVTFMTGPNFQGSEVSHLAWACGLENDGGKQIGESPCSNNNQCRHNFCNANRCIATCCKAKDCVDQGFPNGACTYGTSQDKPKQCFEASPGSALIGEACETNTQCVSRYCDTNKKCANVCCTKDDCESGESCEPSPDSTPYLRCVKN